MTRLEVLYLLLVMELLVQFQIKSNNWKYSSGVVTSGSTNTTIDAGFYQQASLGNYVWFDEDKDGVQDANEVGMKMVLL
ncbi:MAG: hypothetical protein IPP01_10210 [Saprospiraceae bacterium]|nr:hypothetical protein [Saprospiraceae bacterium]